MRKIINNLNNLNNNLQYFVPDNICAPAVAAFATRLGGVSGSSGDDQLYSLDLGFKEKYNTDNINENVLRNYKIIADELGFSVNNIIYAHQKHTDNILIYDENFRNFTNSQDYQNYNNIETSRLSLPDHFIYDAMVTDIPGILLSVRSADCVPVLFWDEEHNAVGAAHCGWRGTIQKLQVKTALKMHELYNTDLRRLKIAIGPCISKCCYEVSEEFFRDFVNTIGTETEIYFNEIPGGKYMCDLKCINKMLLETILNSDTSNNSNNIEISQNCTCCEENLFYSHRRQGGFRGTHASFIGVKT